jgi:iron complex outermembrane recepter protein
MVLHPRRTGVRTSCAIGALLTATALLPVAAISTAKAQTPLSTVTIETPKTKAKAKAKVKRPEPVEQAAANERDQASTEEEQRLTKPLTSTTVSNEEVASKAAATSDTASLLADIPGVTISTNGGVSGLPTIHGFADDRLRIKVDGMDTISSCPNHMNPALSYIAPSQIGSAQVWTGVTPVSISGDSIGGTIIVDSREPLFAAPGQGVVTKGSVGSFYRSNGDGLGGNFSATVATQHFSASYDGSYAKSDNYFAGGDFKKFPLTSTITSVLPQDEVGSTAYEAQNHLATLAYKNNGQLIEFKANYQNIPYELYPNQRMDMLGNEQIGLNLHYSGEFNWGKIDSRTYWQHVDHFMDFGEDKLYSYGALKGTNGVVYPVLGMPMYTETNTVGHSSKVDVNLTSADVLRVGYDVQFYRLDDWWPPAPDCGVGICTGGMAPLTFWNINDGKRDRYSPFLEWEHKWSPAVATSLGARYERIETDTGPVQGYNTSTTTPPPFIPTMYETSSVGTRSDFNTMDRARDFDNVDLSALIRYTPNANIDTDLGLSRTARAPNLYELYSWSRNAMALEMNNFVGDGNGYLGNPFLKSEIANKVSANIDLHSRDRETAIRFSPYYSYVEDYIDAVQWDRSKNLPAALINQYVVMKYMNEDAVLYGFDLSAKAPIAKTDYGDFSVAGMISYTNGRDISLDTGLYNIMPFNGKLALIHKLGGWQGAVEFVGVSGKDDVSDQRNEMKTPGYGLLNLRGSYAWDNVHFNFGVENVLDKLYYLPLGGAYTGEGATMSFNREAGNVVTGGGNQSSWGTSVAGPGRTFYVGMKIDF